MCFAHCVNAIVLLILPAVFVEMKKVKPVQETLKAFCFFGIVFGFVFTCLVCSFLCTQFRFLASFSRLVFALLLGAVSSDHLSDLLAPF